MAIVGVSDAQFEEKVINSDTPVLIDFWAPWCGPCRMADPVLEELSAVYQGKIIFYKMNVDENQVTPGKFGVMSIPTTILISQGKEIARQVGFAGKQAFEDLLENVKGGE